MRIDKKIHPAWLEWEQLKRIHPDSILEEHGSIMGKWQYIYESDDGTAKISLVELPNYFLDQITLWEIYCLEGGLFEDIERFKSKEEAEREIKIIIDNYEFAQKEKEKTKTNLGILSL